MTMMDGKLLAKKIQGQLKERVAQMSVTPGLLVILVGEDAASEVYVRNKARDARKIGIRSETVRLPETVLERELLALVARYNADPSWHGILVQLPLPAHINAERVLEAIDPDKDVDGFHPINMGRLWAGHPDMVPSTPAGIMRLCAEYGVALEGKRAVVIGRSNIVGKPIAQLLLMANATVTLCHSRTVGLAEIARRADILIVAIGRAKFVTRDFVKPGAVVVDVGMDRDENGKLCGDVDFDDVAGIASYITPVPGGVGPMTRAMLMVQTVKAAEREK